MGTRHISFRIEDGTYKSLDDRSRQSGQTRSHVAKTLLEEGLRMEAHPGIVFRPGPMGRRPSLASGPDVWEIVRVLKGFAPCSADEAVDQTAKAADLTVDQVRTALRYYADHAEEVDAWIDRIEEETDRAEAAWQREQDVLRR